MEIGSHRYLIVQKHPVLEVEIDGQIVRLCDPKPTLHEAGIIYIGLDGYSVEFKGKVRKGCVRSAELMAIYDEFGKAISSKNIDFSKFEVVS